MPLQNTDPATSVLTTHDRSLNDLARQHLDIARTKAMHLRETPDTSTWQRLASDFRQNFVPQRLKHQARQGGTLPKPNLSKYVRKLNARGSLLYWKAANCRTDGRTDASRPSSTDSGVVNHGQYDVDFGVDHPTTSTAQELRVLAQWIDLGAGWGSAYDDDTIAPTLNFVATHDAGVVDGLVIGTTDVGTGIAPSSLTVCVARDAGCASIVGPFCGDGLGGQRDAPPSLGSLFIGATDGGHCIRVVTRRRQ